MRGLNSALDIASKLIAYESLTPNEAGIYSYVENLLPGFKAIRLDKDGVSNLFLYRAPDGLDSMESKPRHLCFAGHVDVVAPGGIWDEGDLEDSKSSRGEEASMGTSKPFEARVDSKHWIYHPFKPTIDNGYLHGRGAQDMKGGLACFLAALRDFVASPSWILSVLLTSDEEGPAIHGTKHALEILNDMGLLPTHCIVAEPSSESRAGDTIKIGRRGSLSAKIRIEGKQGHVAYPSKCINPLELLGDRLGRLAGVYLDNGSKDFEASKLVMTDMHAGLGLSNVTPSHVDMLCCVRNSTATSLESFKRYLAEVLDGLPYSMAVNENAKSFITADEDFLACIESSISSVYEDRGEVMIPKRSTGGGTSDARFFSALGVSVAEIGVCNDRIHAVNERVKVEDLEILHAIFLRILQRLCS